MTIRSLHASVLIPLAGWVMQSAVGCTSAAGVVKNLGNDHALLDMTIVTPWGTQHILRANPTTQQSVTISPDGTIRMDSK